VLAVAAVFLVASHLYLAYTLWRFRERVGERAAYLGTSRRSWLPILAVVVVRSGAYRMRGEVVVEPLEDLQKWLAEQPTFADLIP